jgi:iron complex transport system substrate-binding protein
MRLLTRSPRPRALGAALPARARTVSSAAVAAVLLALSALPARADHAGAGAGGAEWLGPKAPPAPRRVVALAPSLTDTAVALGKAGLLVGVTRYDDAPEVKSAARIGGFLDPSPEAVLALRPDLVLWVTDGGAAPAVRRIAQLGVPVLALPIVSVADVLAAARLVGKALGDAPAGERLASSLEAAIEKARRAAPPRGRRRVLFVVGREPLVVAGPGSFPDELLRLAGGDNVVQGGRPWPVYPVERAVADDPDLVIDGAVLEPPEGLTRLTAVPAVKRGAVYRLHGDGALRPGPKLAAALEELSAALRARPDAGSAR